MAAKSRKRRVSKTRAVTTGTTMRIQSPDSSRKPKPNMAVVMAQEMNPVGGFVNFLREHAIVGLAIGFVIGQQAQLLVTKLVDSFIKPLSTVLFGSALNVRSFNVYSHGQDVPFNWGAFAYALLNFLFVLAAIYAIVKFLKLDKLDKLAKDKGLEEKS